VIPIEAGQRNTVDRRSPSLTLRVGGEAAPRVQWGEDEL